MAEGKKKSNNGYESSREPIKAETLRVDKAGGRRRERGEGVKKKAFICIILNGFPF